MAKQTGFLFDRLTKADKVDATRVPTISLFIRPICGIYIKIGKFGSLVSKLEKEVSVTCAVLLMTLATSRGWEGSPSFSFKSRRTKHKMELKLNMKNI